MIENSFRMASFTETTMYEMQPLVSLDLTIWRAHIKRRLRDLLERLGVNDQ